MEAQQQQPHGSRFQDKLGALLNRLYEIRNGLHRVEGILHGGPPETKNGVAPSPGDLQSTVREGHNVLDEIETSLRRVVISLGLESDQNENPAPGYPQQAPGNGHALGGTLARR